MSMNLRLEFRDDDDVIVHNVELVQTPTNITYWCLGFSDRDDPLTNDEIKDRYFSWLDGKNDHSVTEVNEAFVTYAKYTPNFFAM